MHTVNVEADWLNRDELHVVVAQIKAASVDVMLADGTRPSALTTMRELLGDQNKLSEVVSGNRPAVVIFPELAFGLCDWTEIDELIRRSSRPTVVIAGFGFSSGDSIAAWKAAPGPTVRRADWLNIAQGRVYNGGWCWIHQPGNATICLMFLKCSREQLSEIHVELLDYVDETVVIEFNDLTIFPLICSDFLTMVDGRPHAQGQVADHLRSTNNRKKILVAGLLLQRKSSPKWRNAIASMATSTNQERVNLCFANSAQEFYEIDEADDRWRSYSGAYIATGRHPHNAHFSSVRCFHTDQLDTAVVRTNDAVVLGGPLRWTFSATGKHVWAVAKDFAVANDGTLGGACCPDRFKYEAIRFIQRLLTKISERPGPASRLVAALTAVATHLFPTATPRAENLCKKTLFGDGSSNSHHCADEIISRNPQPLKMGFKSLGALTNANGVSWQGNLTERGQMMHVNGTNILVWCNPGSAIEMRQTINRWKTDVGPVAPLIVFKKAFGETIEVPHAISERRQDISEPPPPRRRSIAEPGRVSNVVEMELDDLEGCFAQNGEAFEAAVEAQLAIGFDRFMAPR